MPTYAILGATGSTGGSILQLLTQSPDNTIHCYVRNKTKLLSQQPSLASNPNVKIFSGSLSDTTLISSCLANTQAAFLCVAPNANQPGCHLAQDAAAAALAACLQLNASKTPIPRLIMLSAAPTEPSFMKNTPRFVLKLLNMAFCYVYADLAKAEALIRAQSAIVQAVFVKPGGLTHDIQQGYVLSEETASDGFLSFLDLAAGMIEVARDEGGKTWGGKSVSVLPTAKKVRFEWTAPLLLVEGLVYCFFPFMYRVIRR